MNTIEQKKSDIDAFLQERNHAKRVKLEMLISGSGRLGGSTIPMIVTVVLMGTFLCMVATGLMSTPVAIPCLFLFIIFGLLRSRDKAERNQQMAAMKDYLDLRLDEKRGSQDDRSRT
jgi:hypothetical protein